jgi:hypothetical protein
LGYITCSSKGLGRKYMYPQSRQMCVALSCKTELASYNTQIEASMWENQMVENVYDDLKSRWRWPFW